MTTRYVCVHAGRQIYYSHKHKRFIMRTYLFLGKHIF